jgi:CHAD domain-containing protein
MPFSIRPDRAFTAQFRRAARRQLRNAIKILDERPHGIDDAIHQARKRLKRVRSLYRLVSREMPEFCGRENARLRDIAASLSTLRDAAALVETATYLRDRARDAEEAEAIGRIVAVLAARRDQIAGMHSDVDAIVPDTIRALKTAIMALEDVHFAGSRRKHGQLLAKGWSDTVRKARKAIGSCQRRTSAEAFHTLRKRTQDYRAYHRLLSPLWPAAMAAKYDVVSGLIDLLGRVYDLELLCDLVETEHHHFDNADDLAYLLYAIIFHQQQDRQAALEAADDIFDDNAQDEASRIELLWVTLGE